MFVHPQEEDIFSESVRYNAEPNGQTELFPKLVNVIFFVVNDYRVTGKPELTQITVRKRIFKNFINIDFFLL